MKAGRVSIIAVATALCGSLALIGGAVRAQPATGPVVVELYQSQGCSDCPPAQDYLNRLADRPDVLALSFGVTYWDYLGWKDSFASPQFTQRQRDYAKTSGTGEVATPQFWVNGQSTVLGANAGRVAQLIASGARSKGPSINLTSSQVSIGSGSVAQGAADVWLVRYDPRTIQVAIRAGENGGRTLPHRDIVRQMTKIGRWTGRPLAIGIQPPADPALKTAILIQAGSGGPILSAAKG